MGPFCQSISFLRLQPFFSLSTHPIKSNFSVVVRNYMTLFIEESFFSFLQSLSGKIEKVSFSCFLLKHWNIPLTQWCSLSIQTMPERNRAKKGYSMKFLQWCIFYPIAKDPDHEIKMQQKSFFYFCYHLSYT